MRRFRKYGVVVFDWDGTLMDSTTAIAESIRAAARDIGYPVPELDLARHVIGLGLQDALSITMPNLPFGQNSAVLDGYRKHFKRLEESTRLYDGVISMLQELRDRGCLLAIATGKSQAGLLRGMSANELSAYFADYCCADMANPKPAPDMLHYLMRNLSSGTDSTLMIGDTTHDLLMARNAGIESIAISHGAHREEDLLACHPLECVANISELKTWLLENL